MTRQSDQLSKSHLIGLRSRVYRLKSLQTGFTLIELLAAIAILAILMVLVFSIHHQVSRAWIAGESRTESFQSARLILEMMGRELESAIAGTNGTRRITFLSYANANSLPSAGPPPAGLVGTPPNDQLFFVTTSSDSLTGNQVDFVERGYFVAFATANAYSMKAGHYYLLRHAVASTDTGWDIFTPFPNLWYNTPDYTASTKTPILDNVLALEFRYEGRKDDSPVDGTAVLEEWREILHPLCTGALLPSLLVPSVTDPEVMLPRAVHIRMAVTDRRSADRLAAVRGNTVLTDSDLGCVIPYCDGKDFNNMSTPVLQTMVRDNVRIFYKTVYLRNAAF